MIGIADQIAQSYLTKVKIKSDFISAVCPFHKGGQERHPSFWVQRTTGYWGCYTCQAKGSNLKLLLKELGVRSKTVEAEIEEALKNSKKVAKLEEVKRKNKAKSTFAAVHSLPDSILGVFDWVPEGLLNVGYTEDVLRDHDIGYDRRNDRITFPVRDIYGTLVGIYGRATAFGDLPKYLAYSGPREVDGKRVLGELGEWCPTYSNAGIRDHLWRGHVVFERLFSDQDGQLIVVEGFKAALWLVMHGWHNTVALMGTKMTQNQERIIRRMGAETFVLLDNNEPGRAASEEICQRLAVSSFPVYQCSYPEHSEESAQPDDLAEDELEVALTTSKRVGGKKHVSKFGKPGRLENNKTQGSIKRPW